MPTYEYVCKTCGKIFEYFQPISAEPLRHCPEEICPMPEKGKGEVERKISGGVGLIFKGEGFYITDYVRKGQQSKKAEPTKANGDTAATKADSDGGGDKAGVKKGDA